MTKHEKIVGFAVVILTIAVGVFFYLQSKEAARIKAEDEEHKKEAVRQQEFREAEGRRELEAANKAWQDEAASRRAAEIGEAQQHSPANSIVPCSERGSSNLSQAYRVARENAADDFNGTVSRMSSIERGSAQFAAIGERKDMLVMFYAPYVEPVATKFLTSAMADPHVVHALCGDAFQKVASVEKGATGRLRLKTVYVITSGGAVQLSEEEVFKMQVGFESMTN